VSTVSNEQGSDDLRNADGGEENSPDPVPPAIMSDGKTGRTHERSHAAHLGNNLGPPHTKPTIDMRESKLPGKRKQP
jgi:hypothetical protein